MAAAVLGPVEADDNTDRPGASRSRRARGEPRGKPRGEPRGLSDAVAVAAAVDGAHGRRDAAEEAHTGASCNPAVSAEAGRDVRGLAAHRGRARGRGLPGAGAHEAHEAAERTA